MMLGNVGPKTETVGNVGPKTVKGRLRDGNGTVVVKVTGHNHNFYCNLKFYFVNDH